MKYSQENKMTASNLSICVGPSLMWTHDQAYMMDQSYSKEVSTTVQILIDQFPALYGEDPPPLFREGEGGGGGVVTPAPAEDTAPPVGGAGVGPLPAERTSSLSSTKSENGTGKQKISKKGDYIITVPSTQHPAGVTGPQILPALCSQIGHFKAEMKRLSAPLWPSLTLHPG